MKWFRKKSKLIEKIRRRDFLLKRIESVKLDMSINSTLDELNALISEERFSEERLRSRPYTLSLERQLKNYVIELREIEKDPEIRKQLILENLNIL